MFRLTASYAVADPSGDNNKHTGISIGAGVKVGVGEVLVQGIQQKVATGGTEPKSTTIGVAYVHPLSRRTNVYATYGQTRNNTTGNFALRAADETIAPNAVGNDPKAFSVGVRHTF
jgi:predicted porin